MVEAILEGLLLRDAASEQLALDIGLERREELHKEWDSAAEKEKLSRTKYAQSSIQPGEVARELAEMRASLGTASDVRGFAEEALRTLRADVTPVSDGFTADHRRPPGRATGRAGRRARGAARVPRRPAGETP